MPQQQVVIRGGTLIDGRGREPLEDSTTVVEGKQIKQVGTGRDVETSNNVTVIDATGKTVMPGLIDAHMHLLGHRTENIAFEHIATPEGLMLLRAGQDARLLLEAGYTTVKDCGSVAALSIKKAIAEGTLSGPRIVAAGYFITQTFGHGELLHTVPVEMNDARTHGRGWTLLCDGVDECIKAARYALRDGADFIKIGTSGGVLSQHDSPDQAQFTLDEVKAIVQVARNAGAFVTAHCQSTAGMHISIDAGVKTIDHAFYPDDYVIEEGIKREVIFVPTLSIARRIYDGGIEAGYPEYGVRKTKQVWDKMIVNIKKLHDAGAICAAATDFIGTPLTKMGTNALELELLVKYCGYTPLDAITSATMNGAKAAGLEQQTGTIEPGKQADLILIEGNPLDNISILQNAERIKTVMKEGRVEVQRDR